MDRDRGRLAPRDRPRALYLFNNLTDYVTIVVDGGRNWIVQPGDRVRLSSDEVGPDDWYRCVGRAGVTGTPEPGRHMGDSHGLWAITSSDGAVSLHCEPGPP